MKKKLYEVEVWDVSAGGRIVKHDEATEQKLASIKESYGAWPYEIYVRKEWEVDE